jgi:hypothetical protein
MKALFVENCAFLPKPYTVDSRVRGSIMTASISDTLRDAGASSIFWMALAIILVIAIVGYIVTRRAFVDPSRPGEDVKVVHDWIPTGRIDFAGPSIDSSAPETPASFYLQAEEIRLLVSFSGIERREIRWRKATLNEAKRVVNIFHRQMAKETDRIIENATPAAAQSDGGEAGNMAKEEADSCPS